MGDVTATALTTCDTIGEIYRANAVAHPDKVALVGTSRTLTFSALLERVKRLNAALTAAGLQPGDRVAVVSRNRPELFEIFGIVTCGFVPVPINWRLAPDELGAVLRDCRPAATIIEPDFHVALDALEHDEAATLHLTFASDDDPGTYDTFVDSCVDDEPAFVARPDDVACIVYTSGTTGAPKGAQLTHRALIDNARVLVRQTDILRFDDTVLAVMPLFHVGGMWYYAFPAFALGCTTIVLPMFDGELVLAAIAAHRITAAHLVPTMLGDVLSRDEVATRARTLRMVFYAGSPIPLEILQQALTTLTDCDFVQGYGSTESAAITFLDAADHRRAFVDETLQGLLSSCGRAFETTEIRVDALEGGDGLGEILVRSPNIMDGYWGNPEATRTVVVDGWLHTGDVGQFDADGYLHLVDRKSDMIVTGGENVFPYEVETALRHDPDVADAAVFGVPDARWVERVVAAVVPKNPAHASAERILRDLRARLAGYKCPKELIFVDLLPRSATGKVLRRELRRSHSAS
jgi:long-chain acyl-CoA synthetase